MRLYCQFFLCNPICPEYYYLLQDHDLFHGYTSRHVHKWSPEATVSFIYHLARPFVFTIALVTANTAKAIVALAAHRQKCALPKLLDPPGQCHLLIQNTILIYYMNIYMIKACLSSLACQSNTAVESIRQRSPNFTTNLVNSYMYNDTRVCACVRVCVCACVRVAVCVC